MHLGANPNLNLLNLNLRVQVQVRCDPEPNLRCRCRFAWKGAEPEPNRTLDSLEGLQNIAETLINSLNDNIDTDADPISFPSEIRIPLSALFDFSNLHWVNFVTRKGTRSLQDELELYELVDENGGEKDAEIDEFNFTTLLSS